MLASTGLDALVTANDVNRNVLCTSNPEQSSLHQEAYEWAKNYPSIYCHAPMPMQKFG